MKIDSSNSRPLRAPASTELAPCPFCGPGKSTVTCYQTETNYWTVGCGACGSHSGHRPPSDPEGRAKVIALWNRSQPVPDSDRQWWVYSTATESHNRSKVGPFNSPVVAAQFIADYRPASRWRHAYIMSIKL